MACSVLPGEPMFARRVPTRVDMSPPEQSAHIPSTAAYGYKMQGPSLQQPTPVPVCMTNIKGVA